MSTRLCIALLVAAAFHAAALAQPLITITAVPTYGTPEDLSGTASGVDFSQFAVAPYVYVGGWYTKPTFGTPTVPIDGAGNWTADITTGGDDVHSTRIAVFLIPAASTPPQANGESVLPAGIDAMAVASDIAYRGNAERLLDFAGFQWLAKQSATPVGPGPNVFSADPLDIFTDAQGLHLRVTNRTATWTCAEAVLQESFGYGRYLFQTSTRLDALDPNVVAGFFTWDGNAPLDNAPYRELDFEYARWGNGADPTNAQYVVQPFSTAGNLVRYTVDLSASADLTHVVDWEPAAIRFTTYAGHHTLGTLPGTVLFSWDYTNAANIPTRGDENFRINFWLYQGNAPVDGLDDELVVNDFAYAPPPVAGVAGWEVME